MNETQLRELILKAISEAVGDTAGAQSAAPVPPASGAVESGEVRDLSAVDFRQIIDVPTPANPGGVPPHAAPKRWPASACGEPGPVAAPTPTCGSGRITRPPWTPCLPTCGASAGKRWACSSVQTLCETKDMYLTRPDLGRRFSRRLWPSSSSAASASRRAARGVRRLSSTSVSPTSGTSCPPPFKG